jgi:hypothetical protein
VPALADTRDVTHGTVGVGDEPVDQRRLADAGLPEQHAGTVGQPLPEQRDPRVVITGAGDDRLDAERLVEAEQLARVGQVVLGQAEQRDQPAVVRRHEAAVDQPLARRRVGQRGDDDEHLGVGDDGPLDGSVSSGVRRSSEVRGSMRTMRASASGPPARSPTSATRSPTTTARRPSSRARTAVSRWPSSVRSR